MKIKSIVLATFFVAIALPCVAKKDKKVETDKEDVHVNVILFSGDTINGYLRSDFKTGLKNMFSKSGTINQYINVGEQPRGGETRRLSASEVKEYHFLEPTEGYPEGARTISERINSPVPFKPHASVRGFAYVKDTRECGTILWWRVWKSYGGRNTQYRLVTAVGVKLKGAKAAYPLIVDGSIEMWGIMNYLKRKYPELYQYINEYYFKGKDGKAHRKELLDNPSTFMVLYEDFLKNHEPLSDPDEELEAQK
ncbi:MAG: hypothetical protein K2N79_06595 [Muribaculaceae bacterium]|nr:hypothetical protein [Muribaculaceae bacterium]